MCRAIIRCRAKGRSIAWPRTRARWARAPRRSPPIRRWRGNSIAIPTARRRRCAPRSPGTTASTPTTIVCGTGSDELISLIAHAYAGPGDEVLYTAARLSHVQDRHAGDAAPRPWRRRKRDLAPTSMRCWRAVTPRTTSIVLPRQPEQPHRHATSPRRGAAPARGAARQRAAGDRRGLRRICAPQRLRGRARAGATTHDNVVMTRTFSKIYGLAGAAPRLGLLPAGGRRCAQPRARAVQRDGAGAWPPAWRRSPTAPIWTRQRRTTTAGCRGSRSDREARAAGHYPASATSC